MNDLPQTPNDVEMERATLGALLLDRDAIVSIAPLLQSAQFYLETHRLIYTAIRRCYDQRIPPDLMTVASELRRTEHLTDVGDIPYLMDLCTTCPTALHVEYYAERVREMAGYRALIKAGQQIAGAGYQTSGSLQQAQAQAAVFLQQSVADTRQGIGIVPISTVIDEVMALFDAGVTPGTPSGLTDYDALTGGMHDTDFIILAARPGVGKTSLALNVAYNIVARHVPVTIYSLEMSRHQLLQRIMSSRTGLDMAMLRVGRYPDGAMDKAMQVWSQLAVLPLHIWDDRSELNVDELISLAHEHAARYGKSIIMIDYVQLMNGPRSKDNNRQQEVTYISKKLKGLAKDLQTTVLGLCQLSRAVEGRATHVPMLSDLRESGSLEQDADQVVFIYREDMYDKDTDKKGVAELHIAKHRNGPTGVVNLFFDAKTTTFRNLSFAKEP